MEFIKIGPTEFIFAFLWLSVILIICGRAGGAFLALIKVPQSLAIQAELSLFSVAAGIILLALSVLGLGTAGLLTQKSLWFLLAALALLPSFLVKKNCFNLAAWKILMPKTKQEIFICLILMGVLILTCVQCGAPPIGNDALAYHLEHPKQFIQNHKISYLPLTRESLWPFQTEMLFTASLLLHGTTLAQLFHWCFYLLITLSAYLFGRRFYGNSVGWWAALVFACTPVVLAQSSEAYVDLSLTFFVFLSIYALWLKDEISDQKSSILCGLFIGAALATKYLALPVFIMIFILLGVRAKSKIAAASFFVLATFLVAGVWYLRSFLILENPFYPFLSNFFGGHGFGSGNVSMPVSENLFLRFLRLGWDLTIHPAAFGGVSIGPLYLMALPLLLFRINSARKESIYLAIFASCYVFFIFFKAQAYFSAQSVRFFMPIMPLASIGVACAIDRFQSKKNILSSLGICLCLAAILLEAGIGVYRASKSARVLLGLESPSAYLERRERSYLGYRYLNEEAPQGSKIFNAAEVRYFYNQQPHMAVSSVPLEQRIKAQGQSMQDYLEQQSFDYLWLSADTERFYWEYADKHSYQKVFSYSFTEGPKTFQSEILKKTS